MADGVPKHVSQDSFEGALGFLRNPLYRLTVCHSTPSNNVNPAKLWSCPFLNLLVYFWCQGRFATWTVKNKIETSFDESEFLEGAKDAFFAGMHSNTFLLSIKTR